MKALRHWMLHNDTLAQEFDAILKLSPGYNPLRLIDPAITFFASLLTNTNDVRGRVGAFIRSSTGIYRPSDAKLTEALADTARHEWQTGAPIGLLMELASTNKCQNWNAAPDAALSGVTLGGDASATLTRVDDAAWLSLAGLDRICPQYAIRLNNTGGSSEAHVLIDGGAGNLNAHQCSVYWRGIGTGRCQTTGPTGSLVPIPASYERYVDLQTPTNTGDRLMIVASAGSDLYFVLNQFEEQLLPTSPIITKGTAASRAVDDVSWPLGTPSFVNQAVGMGAIRIRYPIDPVADLTPGTTLRHHWLSWDAGPTTPEWFIYSQITDTTLLFIIRAQNAGGSDVTAQINASDLQGGIDAIVAFRWVSGSILQIGFKQAGVWKWGSNVATYSQMVSQQSRLYSRNAVLTSHQRDIYFWNEDRGTAWLEDFFSDVAN